MSYRYGLNTCVPLPHQGKQWGVLLHRVLVSRALIHSTQLNLTSTLFITLPCAYHNLISSLIYPYQYHYLNLPLSRYPSINLQPATQPLPLTLPDLYHYPLPPVSVGEPSTQMTLNTFHLAGHGGANVTLGMYPSLHPLIHTFSYTHSHIPSHNSTTHASTHNPSHTHLS